MDQKRFSGKIAKTVKLTCLAIITVGIIGMLVPREGDLLPHMRSLEQVWIIGHMLIFFAGCYLSYMVFPALRDQPFFSQIVLILSVTLLISFLIEGTQTFIPGRFGSIKDVAANVSGAMACLALKNRLTLKTLPFHVAALILVAFFFWPLLRSLSDESIAYRQFPLLAGFQTPLEKTRFRGDPGQLTVTDQYALYGSRSLRVKLGTETYSGFSLAYMPGNWESYSALRFAVYNPQPNDVLLTTRIHDTPHARSDNMLYEDRYNRRFTIYSEKWTIISIPLGDVEASPENRKMDMKNISNIGFFVTREPEPLTLYIDYIRLE